MKTVARARLCLIPVLLCTLIFIFGNSMLPTRISKKISAVVTESLGGEPTAEEEIDNRCSVHERQKAKGFEYYVRKAGHFLEYSFLGGELTLLLFLQKKEGKERRRILFTVATTFPLLDETIQIFSNRGPMVEDIWIDIAGFTVGCFFVYLLRKGLYKIRQRKYIEQ